jgi:uncharacterized membrane protein YkoI
MTNIDQEGLFMTKAITSMTAAILCLFSTVCILASAEAPVTSGDAREIALDTVNGEINNIGLEHENGTLVYDVDMVKGDRHIEVTINATTGKVISLKKEMEHP